MRRIKFLHCSDIHMDRPFSSLGPDVDKPAKRRADVIHTFDDIIDMAEREAVDILIIAGDMFEHEYVRKSTIIHINERFAGIPDIDVFIVPGNHDPYLANSFYRTSEWSRNVHILTAESPEALLEGKGIWVQGLGFERFIGDGKGIAGIKPAVSGYINILVLHGTVDMAIGEGVYNPVSSRELDALGMDYIALGHFHNRLEEVGGCRIYNPGSPEPLGFDEPGCHGVFIGQLEQNDNGPADLKLQFVPVNRKEYITFDVSLEECITERQVLSRINEAVTARLPDRDKWNHKLMELVLKGRLGEGYSLDLQSLEPQLGGRFFHLRLRDETSAGYDFDKLAGEKGLRGLFVRRMLALMGQAEDAERKRLLERALCFGLEALEDGRITNLQGEI